MAQRRRTGKKRPPDREPILRQAWLRVIEQFGAGTLIIGGKSLGGRIASLVADEAGVAWCAWATRFIPRAIRSGCGPST
jgi:uncharacterized protein